MANKETEEQGEVVAPDYLNMTDEEIMNAPPPTVDGFANNRAITDQELGDEAPSAVLADVEAQALGMTPDQDAGTDSEAQDLDDENTETNGKADQEAAESEPDDADDAKPGDIDYQAEYKKVFTPFKANGREIAVNSAEDAIALMQMGANYNKKMAALKPNLTLMKMLEKNGLLDEEKINYLIDLDKKNPDAINKLVKDSGMDPMDLDAEKASEYKPNTYAVDSKEIELDTVLEDLQGTPSYTRTLEVVGNKWDSASKRTVADNPQLLTVINDHISSGIYDIIEAEVERGKTFGRLNGLSDIEAYRQVGDAIQARGGFNHLGRQGKSTPPATIVPPKPDTSHIEKLKDKKRAAGSTKASAAKSIDPDFNPLSMSDEEFSKLALDKFR